MRFMRSMFEMTRLPESARRWIRRLWLSMLVGAFCGCAAALLELGIHVGSKHLVGQFTYLGQARVLRFNWAILLLPAFGGLIAGLLSYWLCPHARGHGVDVLTRAFHKRRGRMGLRSPFIKGTGAALVISCGGSAGPEGPIAAIGAAIGSWVGRLMSLTIRERRVLLVAGCAAGIGAIFRCPLGGAMFATGILYREPEFESDAMVPAFVASVVGYSIYMLLWGFEGPMLEGVIGLQFTSPLDLIWYGILGPLCGITAIFFSKCLFFVEHKLVKPSGLPLWATATLGGLATGALACLLPQIMDGRYLFIQNILEGDILENSSFGSASWAGLLGLIVLAKCIATAFTIGSGAPGGVLGPSVAIGGFVGAMLGLIGMALFPDSFPPELRQALIPVGMAGVLAATMRVPLAAIVMTTEMTGSYGLIAPLMIVCVTSYIIGRRWGLNHEQLQTAADSPAHAADPIIHQLQSTRVSQIITHDWAATVTPDTSVDELIANIQPGTRPVFAVVKDKQLLGVVSAADLGHALDAGQFVAAMIAEDLMTKKLVSISPQDDLFSAMALFSREDHAVLPVLAHSDQTQWLGMLERRRVVEHLHEKLSQIHSRAFHEYEELSALENDLQVDQLLLGVSHEHAQVQRLFVPIQAVGQSLRESDFRNQFNAQVIAVEQPDGTLQIPPDLNAPLRTNQRLLTVMWDPPKDPDAESEVEGSE